MIAYLFLLVSLIAIIKAADVLVDASVSIAIRLHVPKIFIALTIVAFSTCAPELAISFNSIASSNDTMAIANVVGSCIINILLIVGVAAVMQPIRANDSTIKKELPLLLLVTFSLGMILFEGLTSSVKVISRANGVLFLSFFILFMIYIFRLVKNHTKEEDESDCPYSLKKAIVFFVLSLIVVIISSDVLVDNSMIVAERLKISEKLITMVAIVIGTSLPELVTSITSAKKKEYEMVLGNIIGTNIFNICIVLGLPVTIFGSIPIVGFSAVDVFFLMFSAAILFAFATNGKKISKIEGIIMIIFFLTYYCYLFINR